MYPQETLFSGNFPGNFSGVREKFSGTFSGTLLCESQGGLSTSLAPCPSHLLGELLPRHAGLKAVPKVDVQQLPAVPVQHKVRGVAVAQAQDVTDLKGCGG